MTSTLHKICILGALIILVNTQSLNAQPGDPGDPDAPITGIEYIIGLGGLYGVKKILAKSKNKK
jgi:hypothetical protein